MELRTLEYFLAVAREESILRASNYLHLTQPTLSRQMHDLEEELGKQLFIRGNRKITLTEDGALFRQRASEILMLVRKTRDELSDKEDAASGDIFIGASEMDSFKSFARAAERLRESSPNVCFHLYTGDGIQQLEMLDSGLIDFALLIEPTDVKQYDFLYKPAAETCGVIMRRDSPLAQKERIRPEDLKDLPLVMPRQFMEHGFFSKWIGEMMENLHIVATADLPYNVAVMVAQGLGYAICLNFDLMVSNSPDSTLCFRPLEPALETGVYIVWKKYRVFPKAPELFLEQVRREVDRN